MSVTITLPDTLALTLRDALEEAATAAFIAADNAEGDEAVEAQQAARGYLDSLALFIELLDPDPLSRECNDCGAEPSEPCRWACTARPDGIEDDEHVLVEV